MELGRKIDQCRMCGSNKLYGFLDLGFAPPSDFILTPKQKEEPEFSFPLKVLQCEDCGLTQLSYAVDPNILYGENYFYESSITETGKKHFFSMADSIVKEFGFKKNDLAIDIGSNVGILLEGFKRNGLDVLGIDPAPVIVKIANERGIETWKGLVSRELAKKVVSEKKRAMVISATNVFAHIDKKDELMESIKIMLDENGVFIVEAPYLVDLIANLEYDTIYLEHLEYLSIRPLIKFFKKYNMDLFNVERNEIHGKSIRVFVCNENKRKISENVRKLLSLEEEMKIYSKETLDKFSDNVKKNREEVLSLLNGLKAQGKKIVGISSPAKGNTILNYCKIDENILDYITEKSKIKVGNYTPGMHIPIIPEEKLRDDIVDYGVILAWNFAEEIMKNNQDFEKKGGKFITLIPHPKVHTRKISEKRYIVTGGNGFLGGHIVETLLDKGVARENIFIPTSSKYDLRKAEDVKRMFSDFPAEIVIHSAAVTGGIEFYSKSPGKVFFENLMMGLQVIEQSRLNNVEKIVIIGSGVMYPSSAKIPLKEDCLWDGVPEKLSEAYGLYNRSLLAQSKYYRQEYGLNSLFLIPANLYGPRDYFDNKKSHLIPSLINKFLYAKNNSIDSVTLWGTGNAAREFLYVRDAAEMIVLALEKYDSSEPLNIGTGVCIPIKQVAESIAKLIGYKGKITWDSEKPEGILKRCYDISKYNHSVGSYNNYTSLEEGLKKTLDWSNNNKL